MCIIYLILYKYAWGKPLKDTFAYRYHSQPRFFNFFHF